MMKFIDFFAGIGGFHSGLEKAGMKCIGWCEFDKAAAVNSETQLYKQAGNAVTVNVVAEIGRHIVKTNESE